MRFEFFNRTGEDIIIALSPGLSPFHVCSGVKINGNEHNHDVLTNKNDIHIRIEFGLADSAVVEYYIEEGLEIFQEYCKPEKGSKNREMKVINSFCDEGIYCIETEGLAGKTYRLTMKSGSGNFNVSGDGEIRLEDKNIVITFPESDSLYSRSVIRFKKRNKT